MAATRQTLSRTKLKKKVFLYNRKISFPQALLEQENRMAHARPITKKNPTVTAVLLALRSIKFIFMFKVISPRTRLQGLPYKTKDTKNCLCAQI